MLGKQLLISMVDRTGLPTWCFAFVIIDRFLTPPERKSEEGPLLEFLFESCLAGAAGEGEESIEFAAYRSV
jgi:hypothetical protein